MFNVIAWVRSQVCRHSPRMVLNHDRIAGTYVLLRTRLHACHIYVDYYWLFGGLV